MTIRRSEESVRMSATITLEEAQAKLPDVIHQLTPGDSVVITENDQPVATLMSQKPAVRQRPHRACVKGC